MLLTDIQPEVYAASDLQKFVLYDLGTLPNRFIERSQLTVTDSASLHQPLDDA